MRLFNVLKCFRQRFFYSIKMFEWIVVLLIFFIPSIVCDEIVSGDTYEVLPPIFHIDDYEKCKMEQKQFCKVSIVLKDKGQNGSQYWKLIQESVNDFRAYNHNELFHAICTNDFCPELVKSGESDWGTTLSECYTRKYHHLGLEADVVSYNCDNHDDVYTPRVVDIIWLVLLISYGILVMVSIYFDYLVRNKRRNEFPVDYTTGKKYLLPFSVLSNWEKLKGTRNAESQKFKCIQGIRFYNMVLIIFCHTYSSYIGGYVHNTSYIENISASLLRLGIRNLMVFLVQTFFLFSAFLLSHHIFQVMEKNQNFNVKFILITVLNRYIRIIPPVLVMIGFGSTIWIVSFFYGPIKDLYSDLEYQRCQKNWWTILLFINNHYNQQDMCYFITWYLAADTQLYVLSLVILSVIWMCKKKTKEILLLALIVGILIPMVTCYVYDLDVIYRITPENAKNHKFRSFQFSATYSSSYANMATFMIGLSLGYIYHRYGQQNFIETLKGKILWLLCFMGLPILVVFTASFHYSRFISAFLSGVLKPIYAIGIAIGIIGMSQKVGGLIKNFCEFRPAVFMGDFAYSTYVVHYVVVFYRTATAKQPLFLSDFVLLTSFITDLILSFFCGFLMHILVEMPFQQIQKQLLPQIRKQKNMLEKEE